jgi:hypothetical protein
MLLHLANVFDYVEPSSGQIIELHHRICRNPHWLPISFEELYAESRLVETQFGLIKGADGPAFVSYLSWHALAHVNFRLKWFADLGRVLALTGAKSCQQRVSGDRRAFAGRPAEVVDCVLSMLRQSPRADRTWQRELDWILRDMEAAIDKPIPRSLAKLRPELASLGLLMRLATNWRSRANELLFTLSDPRDVYALGLGPRYAPVYALAGPVLAIRRRLARGAVIAPSVHAG